MADNQKMILNLFAGMQDALFLGDRFASGEFVSFLQPGQFVSTNLQEDDGSDDMAIQSTIANTLIDSSYVNKVKDINVSNGTELLGSVDQVTYDILNHMALPYKAQSAATTLQIDNLTKSTEKLVTNYNLYSGFYFDAVDAYNTEAHKQIPDTGRLARLRQGIVTASNNWATFGQRSQYEKQMALLTYLTKEDPITFWNNLKTRFDLNLKQAPKFGPFYQTFLQPPISTWNNAGWATFERQISESDTYNYSKSTSWSGGISVGWGMFSFGGGASGSTNYQYAQSSVSTVNIKFDYLRVRILRPWLVEDMFGYRFWTWNNQFGNQLISDGGNLNVTPPVRPLGRMPVLPRYLILVRNLEISAAFTSAEASLYQSQLQSGVSIGWGPFSISGTYNEAQSTKTTKGSFDGITFKVAQPQIIAKTGLLMPKCPNPESDLPWGDDAWIPGNNLSFYDQIRENDYNQLVLQDKYEQALTDAERVKELYFEQASNRLANENLPK